MIALKPCPFCGGETKHDESCIVYIIESHTNFEQVYRDFPNFDYEKAWNTRALPIPDTPEMARALDDAYEAGQKSAERTCIEKECANAGVKCSWCVRNYFADNYEPKAVSE